MTAGRWYTRVVGLFFLLVTVSHALDLPRFGLRLETFHKILHIAIGAAAVGFGWNSHAWWRTFPWANGLLFTGVALFGWLFPDFGGLDAFNRLDTILHTAVGVSGILIAVVGRAPSDALAESAR